MENKNMTNENIIKFMETMANDKKMADKFIECKSLDEMYDFVEQNSEGGFTKEEFVEYAELVAANIEKLLDDDDLSNVSGGGFVNTLRDVFGFTPTENDIRYVEAHKDTKIGAGKGAFELGLMGINTATQAIGLGFNIYQTVKGAVDSKAASAANTRITEANAEAQELQNKLMKLQIAEFEANRGLKI